MDLYAFRKRLSPLKLSNPRVNNQASRLTHMKSWFNTMKVIKILSACLVILPVLVSLSLVLRNPPADQVNGFVDARILEKNAHNATSTGVGEDGWKNGLIASEFDKNSCLSKYQASIYRKMVPFKPSSYLISRLRSYEKLHKRCGPYTKLYNETLEQLNSGRSDGPTDCKYVVWISFSGLGNRILTIASAFLYALLTNRVLLVDPGNDMTDLFCEPFPETSWFLPLDFPIKDQFGDLDQKSTRCYGNMLKNNKLNTSTESLPSYLYLHLVHDYDDQDKLFFCDQDQSILQKVTWLMMKTDNYFVPSLFLIPSFEQELNKLFPEKGTVFHHLGRYLFHPSNQVWGLIVRYYQAYLAKADERIGIQIRTFETSPGPFQHVMDQVLACTVKEKLLPEVDTQSSSVPPSSGTPKLKAVLITSLSSGYFEIVRNLYWENPAVTGDLIGVYQPSHEGHQQTEKQLHNRKAWAEIFLLSLSDVLVSSAWSTFGYVAQGLGGLKPWILYKPENQTAPDPPCRRVMSMEPCFHAPPFYDCKAKTGIDTGKLVPHVRHCEDMSWGLKLVDSHDEL
ncbi:hypothetical protein FEM48_Zijuj10G0086100 [Ziziphus jujuba var. spinosa]|uniref:Fucosyltransferase n=1 Tax=Ziziphus jujuba var. spinosa TaxID=714518 RepID=A0A978UMD0_ZIZJJ|nr:hypothetical protein FEM48_Zijuj10G0086100 [Ziziphus jujuba var. spinosa]